MLRSSFSLVATLVLSLPFLLVGIDWGLPSRASDRHLFGERVPWSGREIVELAGGWTAPANGADLQQDAPLDRTRPVVLNETDAQRADIVRRYRLYTAQPDEMINLRALAQMRPREGQLDPRLYQYGGLWFYPAGAALALAGAAGWVTLTPDVAFYLDRPEDVGRLYVVLRLVVAAWSLAGVTAVYVLCRQMGCSGMLAGLVGLAWVCSPGVVVFGHEAKPHVPGVVWVLWSAALATEYVRKGHGRYLVGSAAAAGGAFGMVLSMLPAAAVPAIAAVLRGVREGRWASGRTAWDVAWSAAVFVATYAASNPYVVWHGLTDPSRLTAQLGNTAAMYPPTSPLATLGTVFFLLVGLTPAVLLALVAYGLVMSDVQRLKASGGRTPVYLPVPLLLLAGPALLQLLAFAAFASGKPGEYARFGLLVASVGVVSAGYLATRFQWSWGVPGIVVLLHLLLSGQELARFARGPSTAGPVPLPDVPPEVTLTHEPAPYNTPPLDLWRTRLVLLPLDERGRVMGSPSLRQPPLSDGFWRMSWADRSVEWGER